MSARYSVPAGLHRVEEEIQRSRFITTLGPAPTLDDARAFIASVSADYADASHNCWAYVVGPPGSTARVGLSDDGEPHGTAGRPILTVLLHSSVGDVVAVVTRYFGGTLLGKGGLVKAYSGGVAYALEQMPTVEKVPSVVLCATFDYSSVSPVQRLLPDFEAELLDERYEAQVTYRIQIPEEHLTGISDALTDITSGRSELHVEALPD